MKVYLGDRWCIFDPSGTAIPTGFVRFGAARDAADVAFAPIFGNVGSHAPVIRALAVEDALGHRAAASLRRSPVDRAGHGFHGPKLRRSTLH